MLVGDSTFPFHTWLLKPFTSVVLSPEQSHFNYCLSRARMVTEGAYGQLKGRWRILLRKCESKKETVKLHTLACVCLHNLCVNLDDSVLNNWDLTKGDRTQEKIHEILALTNCARTTGVSKETSCIRDV